MRGRKKGRGKKRVLIVDDERDVVQAVTVRLQVSGFEVLSAFDGVQGFFVAHKEKPDVILLDIRMPGADGLTVAEQLRNSNLTRDIPVIFLTGSPEPSAQERAMKTGARFYIKKPYDPEELLDAVGRALERER